MHSINVTPSTSRFGTRMTRLTLAGAALSALATGAGATTYVWGSGTYISGATSPNPLLSPDVLQIVSASNKVFNNTAFTNQSGTVDWQNGSIFFTSGTVVTNQSLWSASGDDSFVNNGGAASSFTNDGIFRKAGGLGSTTIGSIGFINNGQIDAQTGTITFNGGNATFNAGTSFTGAGAVRVSNNAMFNGAFSSVNLAVSGGTMTGNNAALSGTMDWLSGTIAGGWTVDAGSTFNAITASNKVLNAGTITNNGTIAWQDGTLFLTSGSGLINNSLVDFTTSTSLVNNGGAVSTITNNAAGTFHVATGNTVSIGNRFINDGGTLDADGVFSFTGGNAVFNAGTVFTGDGTNAVSSSAAYNGSFSSSNLVMSVGTHTGDAAILNGTADWTSGTIAGVWTISGGSTLEAMSASNKVLNAGALTNNGTIAWQNGTLFLTSGSALTNNGLVDFTTSASVVNNGGAVSTITNNASGIFRVDGGHTVSINNSFVNNAGTIDATGTFAFTGGNAIFNAGSIFTGTGSVAINSNAAFNGGFTSSNTDFNSGTFTGTAAALTGTADWSAGTFSGGWTINSGSTLTALGASNKSLNAGTVTNNGTIDWTGGTLFLSNASQLNNDGLIDFSANSSLINNGGAVSTITNSATGTVHVDAGVAVATNNRFINNGGTIDTDGTLSFTGSNATFNSGSVFSGAGINAVTSDAVFNGAFSSTNLDLSGGTFTGNGAVLNGTADFLSGTITGSWNVASAASLNILGASNKSINAGSLTNAGTTNWQNGTLFLVSGSQVTNDGLLQITGNDSVMNGGGAASSFVNNGTIAKTAGAGTTTISSGIGFDNNGTISVTSGTIALPTNFSNDGTLTGTGTFAVSGTLTNNGTIAPGAVGAGTLNLTGSYNQTGAGIFAAQIASSGLADLFNISGTAQLGGTLALSCIGGCSIQAGDTFTLLDSVGNLSGTFANVLTSGFLSGFSYDLNYDYGADRVVLTVLDAGMMPGGGAVPEPSTWAMLIFGFGMVAIARRRRRKTMLVTAAS